MKNKFAQPIAALLFALFSSFGMFAQNMISNGDFESGLTGWNNLAGNSSAATYSLATGTDAHAGTNALKVAVTTLGTNPWDVQSIKGAWGAVSGTSYTLTFWAKAATAGQSFKIVQQINSTYQEKSFTLITRASFGLQSQE